MKKLFILLIILFGYTFLSAQQISNVQQKVENGRIVIMYDLSGSDEYDYTVSLKAKDTSNNTIIPFAIAGDIGNVIPGKNKTIYWEPVLEGRSLEGWKIDLSLKYEEKKVIFVQAGTFQMGSNDGDSDEKPVHKVTISDFYIGKYEVTQKEWEEVMGGNPSYFKGDNLPVEKVSWYDAVEFCNKKSRKEGLTPCYSGSGKNITCNFNANGYRLPTEAEWEYAARGGHLANGSNLRNGGYTYSGSDNIDDVAWYSDNSGRKTHPVGQKQPNELGLYDMSGNVWEWCWDWYDDDYYSSSSGNNPKGPSMGSFRVLRGGSWEDYDCYCRVANRFNFHPDFGDDSYGFRFVRTP